jgi:hypothetical protein
MRGWRRGVINHKRQVGICFVFLNACRDFRFRGVAESVGHEAHAEQIAESRA